MHPIPPQHYCCSKRSCSSCSNALGMCHTDNVCWDLLVSYDCFAARCVCDGSWMGRRLHQASFIRIKLQWGGGLGGGLFSQVGGSKALNPPPLIIPRVSWVGLLPHLLSLVAGALFGCLLVPLSLLLAFPNNYTNATSEVTPTFHSYSLTWPITCCVTAWEPWITDLPLLVSKHPLPAKCPHGSGMLVNNTYAMEHKSCASRGIEDSMDPCSGDTCFRNTLPT